MLIARKLDFSSVRMRLEDDERVWQLEGTGAASLRSFKHPLVGHKYCFLELCVASPDSQAGSAPETSAISEPQLNTLSIQAELVAEGWSKAVNDWMTRHQLPPRFDARPVTADSLLLKPDPSGTPSVPFEE